jgi:hypothetical protein
MKTYLILVRFSGTDPLATLGPASRSGRIFLRLSEPLSEGEHIVLKLAGPGDKSYLLDGIIVSCFRKADDEFHLQADVSQSLAALVLQIETKRFPAPAHTPGKKPFKAREASLEQAAEIPLTLEMENPGEIKEIEELSDIEIIEIQSDSTAMSEGDDTTAYSEAEGHIVTEGALGMDDMRQIVSQEEITVSPASRPEKPLTALAAIEKKTLTDEERRKAEPVGKFLMNLTKAMCRSGYYDPQHPSAASAKKGLYEEFIQNAGAYNEVIFTREKSREGLDITITGVTDEQVSVRMLVGQGVAELFLPKLSDYYDRKGLISFAIRKEINLEHFERFIDIMSDPVVDRQESAKVGDVLTRALIENGITEISTIFISDRIELGLDLPWRVEMAINRLAKDFRVMPMFKGISADVLKKLKMQTIADILRPLKHPRYYSDLLVNCHIIAREVKDVPPEEIENMIVDAFPLDLLIPTSHFTFAELNRLEKRKSEETDTTMISRRLISIRRILKMVARRVATQRPEGAIRFLADLYRNAVLAFEDLPPEAQYLVNSHRLADDIVSDFSKYELSLRRPKNPEDAVVCLKCFRRAAPILIEDHNFDTLIMISALIGEVSTGKIMESDLVVRELKNIQNGMETAAGGYANADAPTPSEPFYAYVFDATPDMLVDLFAQPDTDGHKKIGVFLGGIGLLGVQVMSRVLSESKDKEIRKSAVESMIRMGELSRRWALQVLANSQNAWYLHRNAIMILRNVSRRAKDFEAARIFITHENSRLREEIIGLIIRLRPSDAESLIIETLDDPDARVRWRAVRALADISPISGSAMNQILGIITAPPAKTKQAAIEHKKKIANLISAISGMPEIPGTFRVEKEILSVIEPLVEMDKGMFKLFKKGALSDEDAGVIKAAIPLLTRIGTIASETVLTKIRRMIPQSADGIDAAIETIRKREGR